MYTASPSILPFHTSLLLLCDKTWEEWPPIGTDGGLMSQELLSITTKVGQVSAQVNILSDACRQIEAAELLLRSDQAQQ